MTKPLHVLAVEPYYGGSHRAFLDGVVARSRHRWTLISGPARHWKWRMRSAPLELAQQAREAFAESSCPDLIFCSDMLDLPAWLAFVDRVDPQAASWHAIPIATYFHENQWTYPQSPQSRVDFHYGYTNLLTAMLSTVCWFNSQFHLDSFLDASQTFVDRMPDAQASHDFASLAAKSSVIPPGFDLHDVDLHDVDLHDVDLHANVAHQPDHRSDRPLRIGWVSRWEHDKRPDVFLDLLQKLQRLDLDFQLILLGPRPEVPPALATIRTEFAPQIVYDGFAQGGDDYWSTLGQIDVVVSTADHEFFGIAVCEAIWAGAMPVLPNRLSYPELVPSECLYDSIDHAVSLIISAQDKKLRCDRAARAHQSIAKFQMDTTVKQLDGALDRLAACCN